MVSCPVPGLVGAVVVPGALVLLVTFFNVGTGSVFRAVALLVLVGSVVRSLAVVTADHTGVAVRYRWVTDRVGWQRRWAWSEVDGLYAAEGQLTLIHRGGRSASAAIPWQGWTVGSNATATTFAEQVAAIAGAAGVPVRRETAPLWRPAKAWRDATSSPLRDRSMFGDRSVGGPAG